MIRTTTWWAVVALGFTILTPVVLTPASDAAIGPAAGITLPPPLGCADFSDDPETTQNYSPLQGSSDLHAQTGNDRLVAGLTKEGTITVLHWPTPSSYDQVKHFSPDANLPRAGADPNMGIFLGLAYADGPTVWLRDLRETQVFRPGDSDTVVTTYRDPARDLTVRVTAVVAEGLDAFVQDVEVVARGRTRPTGLVTFENLSLAVSFMPALPYWDWCMDSYNLDSAGWDDAAAAIVHSRSGVDPSRLSTQSVAMAIGTGSPAAEHQVGADGEELDSLLDGVLLPRDAYEDAADGRLGGNDSWIGNTTGALITPLRYRDGAGGATASESVYLTAGHQPAQALDVLARARRLGPSRIVEQKEAWLRRTLADAAMPDVDDPLQTALARRSLILLATTQAESGAIVASITTQPIYAEDWPRDGAYLAEAMDLGGMGDRSARHGRFLARTQSTLTRPPLGGLLVPPGAWPMNMTDTGAAGGPIPYEYDEVGFGAWSMWSHYEHSRDRAYLEDVWPAIRRSAEFMVACRDPRTGLQCQNTEDDSLALFQQQTIGAAMTTYAGLGGAMRAARVLGHDDDAARYRDRRRELIAAVEAHRWYPDPGYYGGYDGIGLRKLATYVYWPEYAPLRRDRMAEHSQWLWKQFAPSFLAPGGERTFGFYDGLAILGLARYAHREDPAMLPDLRRGLRWIAHVQATPGTGLIGENWRVRDGKVETITATPQLWEHALFYLASLEVYGRR